MGTPLSIILQWFRQSIQDTKKRPASRYGENCRPKWWVIFCVFEKAVCALAEWEAWLAWLTTCLQLIIDCRQSKHALVSIKYTPLAIHIDSWCSYKYIHWHMCALFFALLYSSSGNKCTSSKMVLLYERRQVLINTCLFDRPLYRLQR